MDVTLLLVSILIFLTVIGTITDFRKREVPNWITYFLIIIGIGGNLIISLLSASIKPIMYSLLGAGVFYGFSALMFYTGQWGGGDAKLLIGFGATVPIYPKELLAFTSAYLAPWPFLFTLWINILLFGSLFGILGILILAWKHKKMFAKAARLLLEKYRVGVYTITGLLLIVIITWFIAIELFMWTAVSWGLLVIIFYLFVAIKAVEDSCMYKFIRPAELVEGDWIANEVKVEGKVVYSPEKTGLTERSLALIKRLGKRGKIKRVRVKEGLPFVPAFLAGLIVSLFYGDILFQLFLYVL